MVLEAIYVIRHASRLAYYLDVEAGEYRSSVPTPTGIPTDPCLTAHGVRQSRELAAELTRLDPPAVDLVYCSPYYRCLQTLLPTAEKVRRERGRDWEVRTEPGFGEFYGLAPFIHPAPLPAEELARDIFPTLGISPSHVPALVPAPRGESIDALHDRLAYVLHTLVARADADPRRPRAMLVCTHAACMIAIGRVLTGAMPAEVSEEDFGCFTASLSVFRRRGGAAMERAGREAVGKWDRARPEVVPEVRWRGGEGVAGGWVCERNADCSFLSGGEERGWRFFGDEGFVLDPNGFNESREEDKGSRL